MHRSGTSVLSHAIEILGAELGNTLLQAANDNKKGFFENKLIVDLNNELLSDIDCTWDSLIIPKSANLTAGFTKKISALITKEFHDSTFYCIKDPRIIRLEDSWLNALQSLNIQPYYILANRHPFEVAKSLQKRNGIPKNISLLLWIQHQANGLKLALNNNGIIINYDAILQEPSEKIKEIAYYLDVDTNNMIQEIKTFCHDFLDKQLKHNRIDTEPSNLNEIEKLSLELYDSTTRLSEDRSKKSIEKTLATIRNCSTYLNKNKENIAKTQDTFNEYKEAISYLVIEHKKIIADKESTNRKLRSELNWIQSRPIMQIKRIIQRLLGSNT